MTPYPFDYARATSVQEALTLLADRGAEARLLAGGHSLIPAMKLRLSAPGLLVDISGLEELTRIEVQGDRVHVGALATHRSVEHSGILRDACPVLCEAAAGIGDPQVRNKGTLGGSLAHADPAADYPALVLALDAEIEVAGAAGTRTVRADDFFLGLFTTALQEGEMITGIRFPVLGQGTGAAYAKFANPASRFAVVGVAAVVTLDAQRTCRSVRIGVTGAAPTPFRAAKVEEALRGRTLTAQSIERAIVGMVAPDELLDDLSASAAYRAHLCSVMTKRALSAAMERAV